MLFAASIVAALAQITFRKDQGPGDTVQDPEFPPTHARLPQLSLLSATWYIDPSGHVHVPPYSLTCEVVDANTCTTLGPCEVVVVLLQITFFRDATLAPFTSQLPTVPCSQFKFKLVHVPSVS